MSRGSVHCDSCGQEIHAGICDECSIAAEQLADKQIATLTRERDEAREALRQVEWSLPMSKGTSKYGIDFGCPYCHHEEERGHAADCLLKTALGGTEEKADG